MNSLRGVVSIGLVVGAILIATIKGSRAAQPVERKATPAKRSILAAFVPLVCAAVSGATFEFVIPWYMSVTHYTLPSFPWLLRAGMFVCGVIPWFIGSYFAFQVSRTANRALRAVGAVELVLCVAFGAALLFAFTVGVG